MSIRLKIALALLIGFAVGTGVLLFAVRTAYLNNVGVVAHELVADAGGQYLALARLEPDASPSASLMALKAQTGDDYALAIDAGDGYVLEASTVGEFEQYDLSLISPGLEEGVNTVDLRTSGDSRAFVAAIPLGDADGSLLLVKRDMAQVMNDMQGAPLTVVLILVLIYIITLVATITLLNTLVFARVGEMSERINEGMTRMAGGDYEALDYEVEVRMDELGSFEHSLLAFMRMVGATLRQLSTPTS